MNDPFAMLAVHSAFHPRNGASDGYLFDLDASERYVRPKMGLDKWPEPHNWGSFPQLGSMNALLPLYDAAVYGAMWGKVPFGPIMSAIPANLQWQIIIPGLNKYQPQS